MKNSTSDISSHIRGFDTESRIFFFFLSRCSVLPSLRLTPNIRKSLFGIKALEDNTEHLTSFKKIFKSPTGLGF